MKLLTACLVSVIGLASTVDAQNDSCSLPQILGTTGVYAFDNTSATTGTQGQSNPFCPSVGHDLWYVWTSPSNGIARFQTCGMTTIDSNIAVYNGSSCPAMAAIACDDDACGLESFVSWPVSAGATYMLQLGGSGGAATGTGTFQLDLAPTPSNDECLTPIVLGTGGTSYDNSSATTGTTGQSNPGCANIEKDLWYTWTAPLTGMATFETCAQTAEDTNLAVYVGGSCPTSVAIACDNDSCGFQSSVTFAVTGGAVYMLQIGGAPGTPGGPSSFTLDLVPSTTTGVSFCPGDGTGAACPCGNSGAADHGCANSVWASGAGLVASGNPAVSFDTVLLSASSMPTSSTALFFQGTLQINGGNGLAFGDGLRCAGGSIVRLGVKTNVGGASAYGQPLGDIPISVRGSVPPGGATRTYQTWYRNAANFCTVSTFNLSNGCEIVWIP